MKNKYSQALLFIMILLVGTGVGLLISGHLWLLGIILVFLGVSMLRGFREISGANPRKTGLIKFMGTRMDDTPVKGLVLLLDWLPIEIVGVVEFDMRKVDKNFPVESIRCEDGVRVGGIVSISTTPLEDRLGDYDDAGQIAGIHAQISEMIVAWLQEIAAHQTYKWMETESAELRKMLRAKLENSMSTGDISGLGIEINKLDIILKPTNPAVIKADESSVVENLDRKGQQLDTETINLQVEKRYEMYLKQWNDNGSIGPKPSKEKCRREIFDERLAKDGKYTKMVNEGGVNVNEVRKTTP